MTKFHALHMDKITGESQSFAAFEGQTCLIVNVASQCGLTPQYAGLRDLQEKYAARGFTVLGFPCNQFGAQEPGSNDEVLAFAQSKYDVNFPLFAKIDAKLAAKLG